MARAELPIIAFADAGAWEAWLDDNHDRSPGVWLKLAKRGAAAATVTYAEALDAAICFGWIDGQKRGHDDAFWLQRFTPRTASSRWSRINTEKATALIDSGRMRTAGAAQVRAARADGRWEAAYAPQSSATVPDDLRRALDAHPEAAAFFATLTGARRYAFLHRLHNVKTPQGRARRIASYIDLLSQRRTLS